MMTSSARKRDPIRQRVLVAFALVAAATVYLLVAPTYSGTTERVSVKADGTETKVRTDHTATMLEINGPRTFVVLSFPFLIALAPLLVPGAKYCRIAACISGVTLVLFAVISGLSVGPTYSAGALAMMLAAALPVKPTAAG
jgi:hypothetical protein